MNKLLIFSFLILILNSCENRKELNVLEVDLIGKTFNVKLPKENETEIIEFKDSTYLFFDENYTNTWKLSYYENIPFLDFGRTVVGIKKVNDSVLRFYRIGFPEDSITLTTRKAKWKKEQLYGTWIEEKYFGADSTDFPPHPIDNVKYNWPPNYQISEDKIKLNFYNKFESEIEINNTAEFIQMDLKNNIGFGIKEEQWQIKFLSDSIMIVDKIIYTNLLSHGEKKVIEVKLIKKP